MTRHDKMDSVFRSGGHPDTGNFLPTLFGNRGLLRVALIVLCASFLHPSLSAQGMESGVNYEQHNGEVLPLQTTFADEHGQAHALKDYFSGSEPVVIVFGYFRCNQLCSVIGDATIDTLRQVRPEKVGKFRFLYVSIDPSDTPVAANEAKERDVRRFGEVSAEQDWHYLTGQAAAIKALTHAAGFSFRYDAPSGQYAHPSGFLIATPSGVVSRYFLGVDFPTKEVASAIRRAAAGEIGDSVFDLLLLCFHGQGITGRYGLIVWRGLQVAVAATVLGLAALIAWLLRSERKSAPHIPEAGL